MLWKLKKLLAGGASKGAFSRYIGVDETKLLQKLRDENAVRAGYDKVFCIGYNKTGTTSLESVLKDLGFNMPDQKTQEEQISHVLVSGRYDVLKELVEQYDAFQDLPFSHERLYIALDAMFPGSKFILTVRDPDAWYESLVSFHKKVFGFASTNELSREFWRGSKYLHENYTFEQERRLVTKVSDGKIIEEWDLQYDRKNRIEEFNARNNEIIRYFRDRPSDLLCLDLKEELDTSRICSFLELGEDKVRAFPRLNALKS